ELDIHEAAESTAALDQLRNGSLGMVFLDYNMPRLNGADILLGIKRESPDVAIVMMSSALNRGAAGRLHLSGALGFLKKPFYPADVDAVLERYFGLNGSNCRGAMFRKGSSTATGDYCRCRSSENSPWRMRVPSPSARVAAASSP